MSQSPVAKVSRSAGLSSAEKRPYRETNQESDDLGLEMPAGATMQVEPTRKRKRAGTKAQKDPNAPKRATTAFFFFSQEERPNIRAKNPALKVTEISKQLGELWRQMDDKAKEKYVKLAEKDKKRYEVEKAAYEGRVSQGSGDYEED